MKTLSILLLSIVCVSAQLCHTNYSATFTWGTNSMSGDVMTLYGITSGQVGLATYPSTNINFSAYKVLNMDVLYIQGQRTVGAGTNAVTTVVTGDMSYTFNTNNFPLSWGQPHLGPIQGL